MRQSRRSVESEAQSSAEHATNQVSFSAHHEHSQTQGDGVVIGSDQHQHLWQSGQVDYTGRDSFSNIQAHLDSKLPPKDSKE